MDGKAALAQLEAKYGSGSTGSTPAGKAAPAGKTPTTGEAWRKSHIDAIGNLGLDDATEKIVTNALSSKYDKALWMAREKKDTDFAQNLTTVKNDSWALAKAVKAGDMSQVNKYLKSITNSFSNSTNLVDKYYDKTQNAYKSRTAYTAFDKESMKIMSIKDFEKINEAPIVKKNSRMSNDVALKEDSLWDNIAYGLSYLAPTGGLYRATADNNKGITEVIDPKKAYKKIRFHEDGPAKIIQGILQPTVTNWVTTGLKNIDTDKGEQRQKVNNMTVESLRFVAKFGSASDESNKAKAIKLLEKYDSLKWEKNGKPDFLASESSAITDIVSDLGYHGSQYIYSKYKGDFKDARYYGGDVNAMKNLNNQMEALMRTKDTVDKATKTFRDKAFSHLKANPIEAPKPDTYGNTFDSLNKKIIYDKSYKILVDNLLDPKTGRVRSFNDVLNIANKSDTWENPVNILTSKEVGYFKKLYGQTINQYQKQFNNIKGNEIDKLNMAISGFSGEAGKVLQQTSIDIKNHGSNKTQRALKVIDIFKNQMDNDQQGSVYLHNGDYSQAVTLDEYDENSHSKSNTWKSSVDKFFKTDADIDMDFRRQTSIPGKAAYTFTNKETNKSMTMYIDKSEAARSDEFFVQNTYRSHADWAFSVNQDWNLTHLDTDELKDLKITADSKGNYILKGFATNEKGEQVSFKKGELGNVENKSIKEVEKIVKQALNL
jgi:hypothetical protein